MATVSSNVALPEKFERLNLSEADSYTGVQENNIEYGLPLADVYKLALNFYKGKKGDVNWWFYMWWFFVEKEGKAVHFSYEDKLQLVAFSQQILHGPFTDAVAKLPPLGALDVVGRDRRVAWQKLGKLSTEQAKHGFIELLSRKCPLFSTYVEAHRREKKEQERLA